MDFIPELGHVRVPYPYDRWMNSIEIELWDKNDLFIFPFQKSHNY